MEPVGSLSEVASLLSRPNFYLLYISIFLFSALFLKRLNMLRAWNSKPSLQGFHSVFPWLKLESKDADLGERDDQRPRQPSMKPFSSHRLLSPQGAGAVHGPDVGKVDFSTTDSGSVTYTDWPLGAKMTPGYWSTALMYKFEVLSVYPFYLTL